MFRWLAMAFTAALIGSGCASSSTPYMLPESDTGSTARGEAFAGEGIHFRKEMPDRRDFKPWEFYYKRCASTGQASYFSKTSYECSGPYY